MNGSQPRTLEPEVQRLTASHRELIDRIVKADAGSRELDRSIALDTGLWRLRNGNDWKYVPGDWSWTAENSDHPPCYTTDHSAARLLIPHGAFLSIMADGDWCRVSVSLNRDARGNTVRIAKGKHVEPRALCAAVLTAIAADGAPFYQRLIAKDRAA